MRNTAQYGLSLRVATQNKIDCMKFMGTPFERSLQRFNENKMRFPSFFVWLNCLCVCTRFGKNSKFQMLMSPGKHRLLSMIKDSIHNTTYSAAILFQPLRWLSDVFRVIIGFHDLCKMRNVILLNNFVISLANKLFIVLFLLLLLFVCLACCLYNWTVWSLIIL